MKRTELRADPEKDRAWRRRGAEKAHANRVERAVDLVKAGLPLPTIAQVSTARMQRDGDRIRRTGSTIVDRGRGMSASPAQQKKTKTAGACRVLAFLEDVEVEAWPQDVRQALVSWNGPMTIDSAHLACMHACEDPDATVELARPLHRAYDLHQLNLLPYLTRPEEVHAAREAGILGALKRITGMDWHPVAGSPDLDDDPLRNMTPDQQAEVVELLGLADALRKLTGVSWESRAREVNS